MNSKKRHLFKTITWRVIASLTTFLLTIFFFKDDPNATEKAVGVAMIETVAKMILYYYHERVWFLQKSKLKNSVRHLLKTVTWRIIASGTTFVIAFFIFKEDAFAMEKASGIAIAEALIKMILYYLHERVWYKKDLGLDSRGENVK